MVPRWISEKAEEYQKKIEPPYDADDIISAYESGAMENDKRFVYGPTGDPDPAGTSDLEEAAKSSSHLDLYIEGVRRSIEKQIGQLPPPPPGYYYTWELDTIRKEGQFTAIARPLLRQINPEQ